MYACINNLYKIEIQYMFIHCMYVHPLLQMPSLLGEQISLSDINQRSILEILQESLMHRPQKSKEENEVRYKLIVDPSEDNSLMHLLITFGVMKRKTTRMYVCSDFPGDGQIEKVYDNYMCVLMSFNGHCNFS